MRRLLLLVALAALTTGTACRSDSGDGVASATIDGRAAVARDGSSTFGDFDGGELRDGDRLRVDAGRATVKTGTTEIELRPRTELRFQDGVELVRGQALVVAGDRPARLRADTTVITVGDIARVERAVALTAASYAGDTVVRSGGRTLTVPALREVSLAGARLLPMTPSPLDYDAADVWDRRHLGPAIDLGEQLAARSRGFTAQVRPGEGTTPGFYRVLLPALEAEGELDGLVRADRPPGETLVGATIAIAGRDGSFGERWRSTFEFRDAGASWGLVALDQHVGDFEELTERVDLAIGRAPLQVALPSTSSSSRRSPAVPASDTPRNPSPPPPGDSGGGGQSGGSGEPPPEPQPEPEPEPEDDPILGLIPPLPDDSPAASLLPVNDLLRLVDALLD